MVVAATGRWGWGRLELGRWPPNASVCSVRQGGKLYQEVGSWQYRSAEMHGKARESRVQHPPAHDFAKACKNMSSYRHDITAATSLQTASCLLELCRWGEDFEFMLSCIAITQPGTRSIPSR